MTITIQIKGQGHTFADTEKAQAFLDALESKAGVEIAGAPMLFVLLNEVGAPSHNWQEIVREVNSEWSECVGDPNKEFKRVALLAVFMNVMDAAETTIHPDGLDDFREARRKHYSSFIYQEATVAPDDIDPEKLYELTNREIAAGRLLPDSSLRRIAQQAIDEKCGNTRSPNPSVQKNVGAFRRFLNLFK